MFIYWKGFIVIFIKSTGYLVDIQSLIILNDVFFLPVVTV